MEFCKTQYSCNSIHCQSTQAFVFSTFFWFSYLFSYEIKTDSPYICTCQVALKALFVITIHSWNLESKYHWTNCMSGSQCLHPCPCFLWKESPVGFSLCAHLLELQKSLVAASSLNCLSENFLSILFEVSPILPLPDLGLSYRDGDSICISFSERNRRN